MAENKCTGDCLKCSFQQQTYCAAQRGYAIMSYMPAMVEKLDAILSRFDSKDIINPLEDNAQKGSGADNREPANL